MRRFVLNKCPGSTIAWRNASIEMMKSNLAWGSSSKEMVKPKSRKKIWVFVVVGIYACLTWCAPVLSAYYVRMRDQLRGHPYAAHGTHPEKFAGLWVRDHVVLDDPKGQAFYLMSDGRMAGRSNNTRRRWHFDANTLYIDFVYRDTGDFSGVHTTEFFATFDGPNSLRIWSRSGSATKGIGGTYRRVIVNDALKPDLFSLMSSGDEKQRFKARMMLDAVSEYEYLSKAK